MKPVAVVLCLVVAVTTASAGPQVGEHTGTARGARTPRVREVRFTGNLAFDPEALKKILKEGAIEADLARLRSFYFSQGYFDARLGVASVTVDRDGDAILTLDVHAGPKYLVRHIEIDGINDGGGATAIDSSGEFPVDRLCARLLDARRIAESEGRLDFAVELEISHTNGAALPATGNGWVDVTFRVRQGSAYTVGRIDFSGHHRINESTLRRALSLQERALFDVRKLRASLARLNRSGLFEPLTLRAVEIRTKPDTLTADLTIAMRERAGRSWSLSGPLGPSAFGLLEATISSRLPPWGRGIFEASTYYLAFSVTGFSNPLLRLLPIRVAPSPRALFVLERPYLPGQALLSGFALSPQLSMPRLLAGYGLTHLDRTVQAALIADVPDEETSFGICNPPARPHQRLRRGAAIAAGLMLGAP